MPDPDCEHCWHQQPRVIATNPPIRIFVCCECGEKKKERGKRADPPEDHGPYHPNRTARKLS